MPRMRLEGKSAIVTGASSGIGRACAMALAKEGARVALVGRRREMLDALAHEIGSKALVCVGDVRNHEDIRRIVQHAAEKFGNLNVLLNSAGVLYPGTAETLTDDQWDRTFDVNVKAIWHLSRAILPWFRQAGGGSIINISSVLGLIGARNRVAYSASKGAVTMMTKSMAMDHATENIRVNCICPGIVETEMVAEVITSAPDPAETRRVREALHAMERFGQPEEIAGLAVFLASDESKWMTGAAIPVDGGYTAGKA
jgi:NAD(P)-dependent dehydrogenase (short-subunit alcohol dehydrogenase family)